MHHKRTSTDTCKASFLTAPCFCCAKLRRWEARAEIDDETLMRFMDPSREAGKGTTVSDSDSTLWEMRKRRDSAPCS